MWTDLRKKAFEHAELARIAAIIKLVNLMNEEWLKMDDRERVQLRTRDCMRRTTVPPLRVALSVLVVVHAPSADPTAS